MLDLTIEPIQRFFWNVVQFTPQYLTFKSVDENARNVLSPLPAVAEDRDTEVTPEALQSRGMNREVADLD